jgi:hypothetical protein
MIKEIEGSIEDYNSATMSSAFATRSVDKTNVLYSDDTNFPTKMINGKNKLSTAMPVDSGNMRFTWKAFR